MVRNVAAETSNSRSNELQDREQNYSDLVCRAINGLKSHGRLIRNAVETERVVVDLPIALAWDSRAVHPYAK